MLFNELELSPQLQATIDDAGFVECTAVQEAVIPHALVGKDVAGLAQTGTGKTGAFLLPLIERILRSQNGVKDASAFPDWKPGDFILILTPTRELAEQVFQEALRFGAKCGMRAVSVYGGTSYQTQREGLRDQAEFVIGTPGRLIDLFKSHALNLKRTRAVVFDEADRMFDMGFKRDMVYLLQKIPRKRQFLVFSATLNFEVSNIAYRFGADPIEFNLSTKALMAENVHDEIFHVGFHEKPQFLLSLLKRHNPRQTIVFSNFKSNVRWLSQVLAANGMSAAGISSQLTQDKRQRVLKQFKDGNISILVATDVAARGLDILGVDMVVNYELPDDPENYVHRVGRTGRAGQRGEALSLVADRDCEALMRIEKFLENKIEIGWIEDSDLLQDLKIPRKEREPRTGGSNNRGGKPRRGDNRNSRGGKSTNSRPRRDSDRQRKPDSSGDNKAAGNSTSEGETPAHSKKRRRRRGHTGTA